ncbi:hypothetical protein [Anaeromusa sp.]|uniref:hypothetical protein n=1 Tax=Anaeromusa sp. TaxID=1872520 RepID=UPI00263070C9|nr:hypothetical protein [Anaeromusa sp.]MDD3157275.1 hypothetical protein [Anaeromusa sp.]
MSEHGGKRKGAGRPATGAMPTRAIRMTDEEHAKVKEFLKCHREGGRVFNVWLVDANDTIIKEATLMGNKQDCINRFVDFHGCKDRVCDENSEIVVESLDSSDALERIKNKDKYANRERIAIRFSHWSDFLSW